MKDEELVLATLNGEVQAFSLLVKKYSNALCSVAFGVIGDFHRAQDVVQDSFIKAYYKLRTLKEPEKVGSWLYSITYRLSIDLKRKLQKEQHVLEQNERLDKPLSFDEMLNIREIHTEIWKALSGLDERNRIIIVLFHISGFSLESIGKFLDLSVSAVESRMRRTKKQLKLELMDFYLDGLRNQYPAQTMVAKVTTSIVKRAGHFYIPVSDKQRSSEWFVELFGLALDSNGHLILPSQQILYLLEFIPTNDYDDSVPVLSFEVDHINEVYDRLRNKGIRVDEMFENVMTGQHFFFCDLDRNRFGIYQSQ